MSLPADPPPDVSLPGGGRGHLARHGRALVGILLVSGAGVLATAGFQVVVIRGLGPSGYGLLASFLALINVASIGSAALRNSVAVATAEARATAVPEGRRLDASTVEALVLGGLCTVGVLVAWPLVGGTQDASFAALALTALTVGPYFLFARAQGLLQGASRSRAVVMWSTGAQVCQFVLAVGALLLGWGAVGVLGAVLVTALLGTVGAAVQARRGGLVTGTRAFSGSTVTVLLLTIVFTWVTSMDVVLVRSVVDPDLAGAYAAAVTVVKTVLIVPATLSLYLLPRFVNRRDDASMTRVGVLVTLGITLVTSLAMYLVVLLAGDVVAGFFGQGYDRTGELLPVLALAWIPWAMAQALLIRLTAVASRPGVAVLVVLALVQWFVGREVLTSIERFVAFNAGVAGATMLSFAAIHLVLVRRATRRVPGRPRRYARVPTAPDGAVPASTTEEENG